MPSVTKRTPWAWTVATFFGVGNLQPGPGTYGSVAAMLIWLAAGHYLPGHPNHFNASRYAGAAHLGPPFFVVLTLLAILLATALGIPASTIVANEAGREDPGFVVIDEVAGQWLTLLGLSPTWTHALLALALFRLFDIWKPWPIRRFEEFDGGSGIMLDDLVAGAFAWVAAQALTHFVPALR